MTRAQTVLMTAAIAFALPLGSALAQTAAATKCGPETWSTEKMAYTSAPCAGEVGTAGPTVSQAGPQATSSSSMIKQDMKQGDVSGYSPMQEQAAAPGPNLAPMGDQCGAPNAAAITDEYGRKYNCRGDRVR
jgi:hypothetical protein